MDIVSNWNEIRLHFNRSFRANFHVSVASVSKDKTPTITPIGSLFLNKDQTGFYFEKYPVKLPDHALQNPNICILAVNSNTWFWLKSLFYGRFKFYPGLKLYGQLGTKREANQIEINRLKRRMKMTNGLKGNSYLWGDMKFVREVVFSKVEKVNLGKMTKDLI